MITFHIQSNIPIPKANHRTRMEQLRQAIKALKKGDSFELDEYKNRHHYRAAKQVGVKISQRKMETGGWRIWRLK